jgi:hypothetical protein
VSDNKYATDKHGNKVFICNFRWTGPDGKTETCRAPKACEVCGQCSRLDGGGREMGHCPGHLGLNQHIVVPGMEGDKVRHQMDRQRQNRPSNKPKSKQTKRPIVEHKPQMRK